MGARKIARRVCEEIISRSLETDLGSVIANEQVQSLKDQLSEKTYGLLRLDNETLKAELHKQEEVNNEQAEIIKRLEKDREGDCKLVLVMQEKLKELGFEVKIQTELMDKPLSTYEEPGSGFREFLPGAKTYTVVPIPGHKVSVGDIMPTGPYLHPGPFRTVEIHYAWKQAHDNKGRSMAWADMEQELAKMGKERDVKKAQEIVADVVGEFKEEQARNPRYPHTRGDQ